jgi:lipopolysaccharide export system permease protein
LRVCTPNKNDLRVSLTPGPILYRYIAKELLVPTTLALAAFTLVVLTKDFTGYSDLVINRGAGLGRVSRIVLYQSLPLMTQMLPFAVLIGGLVGLGRLAADLEVLVLAALGVEPRRLIAPVALFGTIAAIAGLVMALVIAPWAERGVARSVREIAEINPAAEIFPGVVKRFGNWKLEAREVSSNGQALSQVLLWMPMVGETVFSETADISSSDDGALEIALHNGALLLNTRVSARTMLFDEMRMALPLRKRFAEASFVDPLSGMTLDALSGAIDDPASPRAQREARTELHRRFVLPSAAALFGILALPLALARAKASRSSGAVVGLAITVAYYGLVQGAAGVAQRAPELTALASWSPNLALLGLTLFLYRRLAQPWSRARRSGASSSKTQASAAGFTQPDRGLRVKRWPLPRYVASSFLQLALLCFAALTIAYLLVDILERLQWFARHAATVDEIVRFYSARIPLLVSRVVPMGLLVAMALTVSLLTSSGELVGMRSLGIPAPQALRPALLVCLLVTPLSFLLNDQVVPRTNELADLIKQRDIKGMSAQRTAVWGTSGRSLYQLESLDTSLGMADEIVVYEIVSNGLPSTRIDARSAQYVGEGQWRLRDATGVEMDGEGNLSSITPPALFELGEQPSEELDLMHLSVAELWGLMQELSASGESTTAFEVDLYLKLATPLACLLLPALVMIFAVSGPPFPSSALTLIFAGILAVGYTISAGSFASFARGGVLPPWAGGLGPSLLATAVLMGMGWRNRAARRKG